MSQQNFNKGDYEAFKQRALEKSVTRKIVSVGELKFVDPETINYLGTNWIMTNDAFKQFVNILNLPFGTLDKIQKALGDKNRNQLVALMAAALTLKEDKHKICINISKEGKVVGFTKSDRMVLSNKGYLQVFEEVMNKNPGMNIKNMAISEGGNIEITTLNNNWQFNVPRLKDEYFKAGLCFVNTPQAMIINPFAERLVCTNGNIVTEKGMSLILNSSDESHFNTFFEATRNLRGALDVETKMQERIVKMMETSASLAEVYEVRRIVESNVNNSEFDRDVKVAIEYLIPTKWLEEQFKAHGHDVTQFKTKYLAKVRTNMNVWELLNALTNISSNPAKNGVVLKYANSVFQMQRDAGELMFKKRYDLEEPFPQIFPAANAANS